MTDESTPLAEESRPRFEIWTMDGGMVAVIDTGNDPLPLFRSVLSVPLADSAYAEEKAATWNRRNELGIEDVFAEPLTPYGTKPAPVTPAAFLAGILPEYARRQRNLAEVDRAMDRTVARIRQASADLADLCALREKLTARLTALAAAQAAENASGVPSPTPDL